MKINIKMRERGLKEKYINGSNDDDDCKRVKAIKPKSQARYNKRKQKLQYDKESRSA